MRRVHYFIAIVFLNLFFAVPSKAALYRDPASQLFGGFYTIPRNSYLEFTTPRIGISAIKGNIGTGLVIYIDRNLGSGEWCGFSSSGVQVQVQSGSSWVDVSPTSCQSVLYALGRNAGWVKIIPLSQNQKFRLVNATGYDVHILTNYVITWWNYYSLNSEDIFKITTLPGDFLNNIGFAWYNDRGGCGPQLIVRTQNGQQISNYSLGCYGSDNISAPPGTTELIFNMSGNNNPRGIAIILPLQLDAQPTSLSGTYDGLSWSNTAGRGYVTLSWPPVPYATGYKVWVWDGYAYRPFDIGNVTSWDSRQAKIYPPESTLNACATDSSTSNLFLYGGAGLDLRDSPLNLYRCTAGSTYNSDPKYYFRVTAYNSLGEVQGVEWHVPSYSTTLPDRTDTLPPQVDQVIINGGRDTAPTNTIQLAVYASDDKSGIAHLLISNDNIAWTKVTYPGPGGNITWKLTSGEGSKTVYVRSCDFANNCGDPKSGFVYLTWDAISQSWINSSLSGTVTGITATKGPTVAFNSSTADPSVFQIRWSMDGVTWGPWEPLGEKRLSFPRDGVYSVSYQFRSNTGDLSPVQYRDVVVDSTPPTVKAGWVGNAIVAGPSGIAQVWVEASDNVTPVDQLQMSRDGGVTWEPFAQNTYFDLTSAPRGMIVRKLRVKDQAGNVGVSTLWILKP